MPPPQDEHVPHEEEEVLYMRIHRIRASFMEVFFPDDEVYQVQVVPGCDDLHERTLRTLVKSILRSFRFDQHILFLDGFKASPDDVIIIEEDRTERAVSQVRILRRGLRGGGYEDPRSAIQQILMAKGLTAPEARDKCDEVLSKVPKDSLEAWLPKANWQSLTTLVSNKVTFMPKHKQGKDPLTEKDPWMEALQDRHKPSSSKDHPKPFLNPEVHVHLIPQVWTNEDGSNPQILERVQHGSTGLALLSPQQFQNWTDVQLPLSCDELGIVVWPPMSDTPSTLTHTMVKFPAHVHTTTTSTTLLVGQLFQFGSKSVNLKEDPNPTAFPTRNSVSLMVEVYQENVDEHRWQQCTEDIMGYARAIIETTTEVLGHWGIRYWSPKGKPTQAKEATRVTTNVLVDQTKLSSVLRLSGPHLWLSPRVGQQSFDVYKPIWISGPLPQVRIAHDKLPHSCGIIRSKKGFGIRVEADKFQEAYRLLHPNGPAPTHLGPPESVCQYKMSPAPIGATSQDILDFLQKTIPSHRFAIRRQLSPQAWLIASHEAIEQEYIFSSMGYILLQPWSTGRHTDPIRNSVLVGNPRVLRQVSKGMDVGASRHPVEHKPTTTERPPPAGPVQDLVDTKIRQSEEKILALLQDHRDKVTEQQNDIKTMVAQNQEQCQTRFERIETNLKHQEQELTKALEDVKQSNQQGREALEKSMSEQFANMLRELGKMGKRSPAPSPESSEPSNKALKNC